MGANIRRATIRVPIAAAATADMNFTDNSFTYLGIAVETVFNEIILSNDTNGNIYYSLETDPADAITVNAAALEGVMKIERKSGISEINSEFSRLRITAASAGDVYVILYRNPKALI